MKNKLFNLHDTLFKQKNIFIFYTFIHNIFYNTFTGGQEGGGWQKKLIKFLYQSKSKIEY